ncbi:MAG: hypothetical protein L3J63_00960 [Geopsychrobacter sp.]|nr:hypothetical protein [Geopsychrobacter sp.]
MEKNLNRQIGYAEGMRGVRPDRKVVMMSYNLRYIQALSEKTGVFADRNEAGVRLGELLLAEELKQPLILAIPAGGVPVAISLASLLKAPLEVAVVSKITLPWDSEAGYGAVAFDGSYLLNRDLIRRVRLSEEQVKSGIIATRAKVNRRLALFRQQALRQQLDDRDLILVDDGLASGFTLQAAVAALYRAGAARLSLAVPTAHAVAAQLLAVEVDRFYCANLRGGRSYSVAAAYRSWQDVAEDAAIELLQEFCPSE